MQDLPRALDFAGARAGSGARGRLFGDPLGAQVVGDARGTVLARKLARPRLGVALVGELLLLLELVEQALERRSRFGSWR